MPDEPLARHAVGHLVGCDAFRGGADEDPAERIADTFDLVEDRLLVVVRALVGDLDDAAGVDHVVRRIKDSAAGQVRAVPIQGQS